MNPEFNSRAERRNIPAPLKYIEKARSTHTDLDVMQEKRIDGYWNVDAKRSLSDSWKRFKKITLVKVKPPKGYMLSGETGKSSNDYETKSCVAWSMEQHRKAAQNREKQEWKNEKPKLDNARRQKDTYFIDPDDEEYK